MANTLWQGTSCTSLLVSHLGDSIARFFLTNSLFLLGSGGGELIYSIFGGNVDDLRVFLTEERFPEGWEPRTREAFGHTVTVSHYTSLSDLIPWLTSWCA
jgi:hypothetical protein